MHTCTWSDLILDFAERHESKKRNTESSEADYQTASSADLGDRGMLFCLQSTLHNSVVGCVGVVGLGEGAIDDFKTVFDMQTLTGECVSS